jgi:predicted unusual protein kinase regulating ubiquinone biosynthesis (AarF/ABC1/UbiB family)
MSADLPVGKIGRALTGGHTAAKIGGKMLSYYTKRPFLSTDARQRARQEVARQSAETLFKGLSLLRGTALKMAQQLSLETDLLPENACRELAKAYHQVPPINRALVRKVVGQALGKPPEAAFRRFDLTAFAAASLGQVHSAKGHDDEALAVKIQYPGIAQTIASDVSLLRQMLRPLVQRDQLIPTLDEVAARLREEVDYLKEAEQVAYFATHLKMAGVRLPAVKPDLSAPTVLCTTLLPGRPLDVWMNDNPGQAARDRIAQTLNDLFLTGVYELNVIHADPNPGNFIIGDDLTVGLVDFGCVKRLKPDFVDECRQLAAAAAHHDRGAHFRQMIALGLLPQDLSKTEMAAVQTLSEDMGDWFGRLYADEYFDFGVHSDFVAAGKTIVRRFHHLRRHFKMNPEFIFMDRTRYGLLRLFEAMGARVKFRNPYEW